MPMQSPRLMPAKVRPATIRVDWLEKVLSDPPSPERATKLTDLLEQDVERFPFAAGDMPPEAADAHRDFLEAVSVSRSATLAVTRAHASTTDAEEADIRQTVDAMKQGNKAPALAQTKARAYEDAALVSLQAAERIVVEAHVALTDSIRSNWAAWRRLMVVAADEQHEETARAFAKTRAAIEQRRAAYTAVAALDNQIAGRYPDDVALIEMETRHGVPLFAAAVRPYLPNGWGAATMAKVSESLAAVEAHLVSPVPWAHEWSPPGDPDHARLLAEPVDSTASWVKRSRQDEHGDLYCADCLKKLPTDTPLDPETLKPVHVGCTGSPAFAPLGQGVWSSANKALKVTKVG